MSSEIQKYDPSLVLRFIQIDKERRKKRERKKGREWENNRMRQGKVLGVSAS